MARLYPLYEDNHLIIVNKPAGIPVQPDESNDKTMSDYVKDYIKQQYNKPGDVFLGTVHRLDRPVSGAIVFARTSKALERMNEIFRKRQVQKTYWALVAKRPEYESGKMTNWLIKDEKTNTVACFDEDMEGSQKAELYYRTLGKLNGFWLLEVNPITGRSHQIRAQLSHAGAPIRGDLKYGYPKPNEDRSICLHARRLWFMHPVKKEPLIITAGVPEIPFWEQFLTLDDFDPKDKSLDFIY
ncbi:MAG: RluA family pseudouridine synthase [Bacteroidota bacterium]